MPSAGEIQLIPSAAEPSQPFAVRPEKARSRFGCQVITGFQFARSNFSIKAFASFGASIALSCDLY